MNILDQKTQSKSNLLCAQKQDLKLANTLMHVLVCINVCVFTSLTSFVYKKISVTYSVLKDKIWKLPHGQE